MSVSHRLRQALTSSPQTTIRRAAGRARRTVDGWTQRRRDRMHPTYAVDRAPSGPLAARLPALDVTPGDVALDAVEALVRHALAHRFDLLGSGWTVVRHGMTCRGVEGRRYDSGPAVTPDSEGRWLRPRINSGNRAEAQRLWAMIEGPYEPIDWHVDFKSGYRWSERAWHGAVPYAHRPGVDVKVPWELARLQHLPLLAVAPALLAGAGRDGTVSCDVCARAFRSQVLDFIATNPPRYGVNWRCAMDVAIRVANLVLARDLFVAAGVVFDDAFEEVLARAVYEHGHYIIRHLEWGPGLRSNHYLSNIVGLLFAAAALPATRETDAWLAFGVQELIAEVEIQFAADGANIEASTSYHRLSAEMVVYGTALVLGLPDERLAALSAYDHTAIEAPTPLHPAPLPMDGPDGEHPFPLWYADRIAGMRRFTCAVSVGNGAVCAQIGDNDSGRFFRLAPSVERATVAETRDRYVNLEGYDDLPDEADYWRERGGDHRHLVAAIGALCGEPARGVDADVVRGLARGRVLVAPPEDEAPPLIAFPDFGAWVYGAARAQLVVRAGSVGQHGNGGHAHNDQLSFSLFVDGRPVIVDPGTFLYTPAPSSRNLFRSTAMHNTLVVLGVEQNRWALGAPGLFSLLTSRAAVVRRAEATTWEAEHEAYGAPHRRTIELAPGRLRFVDACAHPGAKMVVLHLHPDVEILSTCPAREVELRTATARITIRTRDAGDGPAWTMSRAPYSEAYGWCRWGTMLELPFDGERIEWSIGFPE